MLRTQIQRSRLSEKAKRLISRSTAVRGDQPETEPEWLLLIREPKCWRQRSAILQAIPQSEHTASREKARCRSHSHVRHDHPAIRCRSGPEVCSANDVRNQRGRAVQMVPSFAGIRGNAKNNRHHIPAPDEPTSQTTRHPQP